MLGVEQGPRHLDPIAEAGPKNRSIGRPVIGAYTEMFGARARDLDWVERGRLSAQLANRKKMLSQAAKRPKITSNRLSDWPPTQRQSTVQEARPQGRVSFTS